MVLAITRHVPIITMIRFAKAELVLCRMMASMRHIPARENINAIRAVSHVIPNPRDDRPSAISTLATKNAPKT